MIQGIVNFFTIVKKEDIQPTIDNSDKFCINCKHIYIKKYSKGNNFYGCGLTKKTIKYTPDIVTGEKTREDRDEYVPCYTERKYISDGRCGIIGKHFEERIDDATS